MKKVTFYTLGCKLNFSETSSIGRAFEERGYQKTAFEDRPDIFVINTCSVTENADKKCRNVVRQARKISPGAYIVIIGCYAQLKPQEIASIPGVDAVLGASEKFRLLELLDGFEKKEKAVVHACEIEEVNSFFPSWSVQDRTRTFLKVQDGCDYSCTFCTIPLARGKSRSGTIEGVLQSAREIADSGVKEIVLTGVNTGDFGIRNGKREDSFYDLCLALEKETDIERIRISSIEPNLLTEDIIQLTASSEKFMPHFHIPLQSGSDVLLKSMRRRYNTALYSERTNTINKVIPDACIGVDVIVGFPGETDEEFLKTYHYLNELDISYLHVFTYSERENTVALSLAGSVEAPVRQERSAMLRSLSEKKKRAFYEKHIGKTRPVLFEKDIKEGNMLGFTDNYIRVSIPLVEGLINNIIPVTLEGLTADGLAKGSTVGVSSAPSTQRKPSIRPIIRAERIQ